MNDLLHGAFIEPDAKVWSDIPKLEPITASVAEGLAACERIRTEYGYPVIGADHANHPVYLCPRCGCEFAYDPRDHKHWLGAP